MKKNKFVKLIEHILVLLPLLFVGGVTLYTIFNENAKDSFSQADFTEEKVLLDGAYTEDLIYYMAPNEDTIDNGFNLYVSNFEITNRGNLDSSRVYNIGLYTQYRLYFNTNKNIDLYIDGGLDGYQWYTNLNASNTSFEIAFKVDTYASSNTIDWSMFYVYRETEHIDLNNAFTYSLNQFNQLGFDKINWVNWFTSIFTSQNNIYITFLNSYLNYFLLVECCYVVPLVMYWFIHLGERLLYKFTTWGDNE